MKEENGLHRDVIIKKWLDSGLLDGLVGDDKINLANIMDGKSKQMIIEEPKYKYLLIRR
jgi:hypothetical protein